MSSCETLMTTLRTLLSETDLSIPFMQQEMPLVPILCKMELLGIGIDYDYLNGFKQRLQERMDELRDHAVSIAGHPFLLTSPQQVAKVLFEEMGLRTSQGGNSTNEEALMELRKEPIVNIILGL